MSDDADFDGSLLSVSGILASPCLAFGFLLDLSSGGGVEFSSGVILSLLGGSELVVHGDELVLGVSLGVLEGGSLLFEIVDGLLEVELSLDFLFLVIDDGLLKGGSELGDLVLDALELLGGEGGGEGDEGEDGVLTTDSGELGEDGFSISFGLDGAQLGGNDVEGLNDLGGLDLSLFERLVVLGSLLSELLLLLVEDVELGLLVLDFSLEEVSLSAESLDVVAGFGDFVGSEVDSSVVAVDFSLAVSLLSGVDEVGILLLEDEVLSEVLEHLGDVTEGRLVLHLEGDGVEDLLSERMVLEGFELSEDSGVGVGGLLDEDSL